MSDWHTATLACLYYCSDDEPDLGVDCLVRFDDGRMTLKYDWGDDAVIWQGTETGAGHYTLQSGHGNDHATLHRFEDGKVLVGNWAEDGARGLWQLRLD